MAYHVIAHESIKYDEMARELGISLEHVSIYFDNYHIYKTFPVRTLTFEEESFVKTIQELKVASDYQLKSLINENRIDMSRTLDDSLHVERIVSRYNDEERYAMTRKYQKYILEPAILHGNFTTPLTVPLSMQEIATLISNMALGIVSDGGEVDNKTRLSALSKLADMYATDRLITNQEKTIDPLIFDNMTPDQLSKIINAVEKETKKIPVIINDEKDED